jgi:hypothetical protein
MLKQEKNRSVKVFYLDEDQKWQEYAETVLGLSPKPDGSSLDLTVPLPALSSSSSPPSRPPACPCCPSRRSTRRTRSAW